MTDTSATERQSPSGAPRGPGGRRRIVFAAFACLAGLLLLEGLLSFLWLAHDYVSFTRSAEPFETLREDLHCAHDPEIGWVNIPGARVEGIYGPGLDLTINSHGFRGPELDPSQGRRRIICLGDSFTLGFGVDDEFTYPRRLAALMPEAEVINMGQGGYSISQAWLWYLRDGEPLEADLVIFAFIPDDISRMGTGMTLNGYSMPRVEISEAGQLEATNLPLPEKRTDAESGYAFGEKVAFLARNNSLMRTIGLALPEPQPPGRDADEFGRWFDVTFAIMDDLNARITRSGNSGDGSRVFAILMLPSLDDCTLPGAVESYQSIRTLFAAYTSERGIPFLSLGEEFAAMTSAEREPLFLDERFHHYSPEGNRLVARRIHEWIRSMPGRASE